MATKQETFDTVSKEAAALCEEHRVSKKVTEGLTAIFETHLKPKASGASVNIDEVTRKDEQGNIIEIMCSLSGVFLPATIDFFYEDKTGKGINGLKRLSRQAESIRKQHIKTLATTEKAIMVDVFDGVITPEEGKAKFEEVKASKPDFSGVTAELPSSEDEDATDTSTEA